MPTMSMELSFAARRRTSSWRWPSASVGRVFSAILYLPPEACEQTCAACANEPDGSGKMYHWSVGGPLEPPQPARIPAASAAESPVSPPFKSALTTPPLCLLPSDDGAYPSMQETQTMGTSLRAIGAAAGARSELGELLRYPAAVGGDDAWIGAVSRSSLEHDRGVAGGGGRWGGRRSMAEVDRDDVL